MTLIQIKILCKKIFRTTILILFFVTGIFIALTWVYRMTWYFEMVCNFLVYYFVFQWAVLIYFLIKKQRLLASIAVVFLIFASIRLIPTTSFNPKKIFSSKNSQGLKVISFNVSSKNKKINRTLSYLQKEDPDIFGLIEIDKAWGDQLLKTFPNRDFKMRAPEEGSYGLALFSKIPFQKSEFMFENVTGVPSIRATLNYQGKLLTILLTHTYDPIHKEGFKNRNQQLKEIGISRDLFTPSLVMMGDFNTTPWSLYFRKFIKALKLKDSRMGFGLQASWPTFFPLLPIPIDHVLTSSDIKTSYRTIGPHLGSDHYPVYAVLNIR